jgi:hypothetical protein
MAESDKNTPVAELTQRQGIVVRRTFTIFPDRLQVFEKAKFWRARWFMYFTAVKEEPDVLRRRAALLWIVGIAFIILASFFIMAFLGDEYDSDLLPGYIMAGIFLVIGPACIVRAVRRRNKISVLTYQQNQAGTTTPHIWLKQSDPSPEHVRRFLDKLKETHVAWQQKWKQAQMGPAAATSAEALKGFVELKNEGLITEDEFDRVKAKLLDESRAKIGF